MEDAVAFYDHAFRNGQSHRSTSIFRFGGLPSGDLAQNSFAGADYSYSQVKSALENTAASPDDSTAYATLPRHDPTHQTGNDYFRNFRPSEGAGPDAGPAQIRRCRDARKRL